MEATVLWAQKLSIALNCQSQSSYIYTLWGKRYESMSINACCKTVPFCSCSIGLRYSLYLVLSVASFMFLFSFYIHKMAKLL